MSDGLDARLALAGAIVELETLRERLHHVSGEAVEAGARLRALLAERDEALAIIRDLVKWDDETGDAIGAPLGSLDTDILPRARAMLKKEADDGGNEKR